ncbi:unnamed protein product [Vitrella brassicaformis CCMP3155]|uniref:J domain-containing protein n=1 Tax=Vitrella brassicaformis (strain CCMP3155) TaxID=1169540 RepID=A0A0G4G0Z7_VITBC|nr:unnamed protein product [Vitrella brassicaformis CCMP3155]|eukprot:CEM21734.1 unnamed protein product [Vitrella brassicaformis CCMP3155]
MLRTRERGRVCEMLAFLHTAAVAALSGERASMPITRADGRTGFVGSEYVGFYEKLQVHPCAPLNEVKKSYHKGALKSHTDKGGRKEDFQALVEAYTAIKKDLERLENGDPSDPMQEEEKKRDKLPTLIEERDKLRNQILERRRLLEEHTLQRRTSQHLGTRRGQVAAALGKRMDTGATRARYLRFALYHLVSKRCEMEVIQVRWKEYSTAFFRKSSPRRRAPGRAFRSTRPCRVCGSDASLRSAQRDASPASSPSTRHTDHPSSADSDGDDTDESIRLPVGVDGAVHLVADQGEAAQGMCEGREREVKIEGDGEGRKGCWGWFALPNPFAWCMSGCLV